MQTWANAETKTASKNLLPYKALAEIGAERQAFQLLPLCSSRHCQAQNTPNWAGRKRLAEKSVCWVQRLYQPSVKTLTLPR